MSVLNDITVQDGLWIREMCKELCNSQAKRVMTLLLTLPPTRMDSIDYSVSPDEQIEELMNICNHHWLSEDGTAHWGLPKGSYKSFLTRIMSYTIDWKGDTWLPDLVRATNEARARDLLLASFLFPFKTARRRVNPVVEYGILKVLEECVKAKVYTGSNAVARLVLAMDTDNEISSAVVALNERDISVRKKEMSEFNAWSSAMETCTSIVMHEALRAAAKTSIRHESRFDKGMQYTSLADLVNTAEFVAKQSAPRGMFGKGYIAHGKAIRSKRDDTTFSRTEHNASRLDRELEDLEHTAANHMQSKTVKKSLVYRTERSPNLRITASTTVVIVRISTTKETFVLTTEDLKSLKYCSMSHAMWHLYASTVDMEYKPLIAKTDIPDIGSELADVAGQVATDLHHIMDDVLGPSYRKDRVKQQVAPLADVHAGVEALWTFYTRLLDTVISMKMQDYFGRYLHELFEVYTSKLGGHLAVEGRKAQIAELIETYSEYGFTPVYDIEQFEAALSHLPLTCVQDFGRLSKIVFAYDVNPMYSYMHRVNAMRKPNPIGHADFTSDFAYTIREHTPAEDMAREYRFKSAGHVLICISDMKSSAARSIDPDLLQHVESLPWPDAVKFFKEHNVSMKSRCLYTAEAAYPVPRAKRKEAREQAKILIDKGTMPTEPYAGAFVDIAKLFSYEVRGEPDLSILKASSIPDSDPTIVLSNLGHVPRSTPTRDNDGRRTQGRGNMISDYLLDAFPSRMQAIAFMREGIALATTSDKIETNKYPKKTRITTGLAAAPRRIQSEYEANNGKVLREVPGFTIGDDPGDVKRRIYASMRDDLDAKLTRIYGSLDLSSWSTGMHWDIQAWTNEIMELAYDGGADNFAVLNKCTKGSMMVKAQSDIKLYSINNVGANYEGVDGKRNTFMHCILWYLARADAAEQGVESMMRAFLYIDDGAFSMEVEQADKIRITNIMRRSIVATYVRYGFKLSILKTVFSEVYMQFLNEIYFHGIHVGYGFRALCHTAAQTFPALATVAEELAVISSGIRGAATSGGHAVRLMAGYHFILSLYFNGVIGNKGRSLRTSDGYTSALMLALPTSAGGFGMPNVTQLFSNLSGHRDVEKHDKVRLIMEFHKRFRLKTTDRLRQYIKANMLAVSTITANRLPDRISIAHPTSAKIGTRDRTMTIAKAAANMAKNITALNLLNTYIGTGGGPTTGSFVDVFVSAIEGVNTKWPVTLIDKALATDPNAAIVLLVEKIANSNKIAEFVDKAELRRLNKMYMTDAFTRSRDIVDALSSM